MALWLQMATKILVNNGSGNGWWHQSLTWTNVDLPSKVQWQSIITLRWRDNDHAGVSNSQPHGCLLNRLFRRKSKKTSKLRVTGLCAGNSPGTGEFPAQMASYAENVSIWWRHHDGSISSMTERHWHEATSGVGRWCGDGDISKILRQSDASMRQ